MGDHKDLIVFKKAYKLAMDIFEESKKFPPEEKFSLTDQIRRSSRSVCTNLAERTERENIKLILFQNYLTQRQKILKQKFGSTFQRTVNA